ncbi:MULTISPECIES: hypothetical protein [Cronobacter]|uniref:hypothetical protein n=1 Tax=Cronobacter TaxID=413496 RepID=UPI00057790F1|nr:MULTISPECIES: hypothetical protein [Cronobacter]ELY6004902.1 hypothetical protein [Cronobacter sakazakii]MDI7610516.1 hypothetical protein [Cronobacter sakazakii]MDI7616393.1 hypothetical protein [Cronobacter sakazakii]
MTSTAKLKAAAPYQSRFSRLWERYDEASHGNAEQMRDILEVTLDALESAEKRIAELEARTVALPRPACTYADHSYPAYSEKQVIDLLKSAGINLETGGEA